VKGVVTSDKGVNDDFVTDEKDTKC